MGPEPPQLGLFAGPDPRAGATAVAQPRVLKTSGTALIHGREVRNHSMADCACFSSMGDSAELRLTARFYLRELTLRGPLQT